MAGLFVVFEGPEGAGKSTQVRLLADRLLADQCAVVVTREPGGTPLGERIRDLLFGSSSRAMSPVTEALLMTAARAQHVRDVIRPALERNEIVLCDRFADSTLAYQGGGRGLPMAELNRMQRFATGGIEPDLRILLDLPVEVGLTRRHGDATAVNRMDEESVAFHRRVRSAYLALAREGNWLVVDATRSPDAIAEQVYQAVAGLSRRQPAVTPLASGPAR